MKNIRDAHLSRWFSSCENDDDGGKSTMADCDLDDKAYFSDDSNTDMESKRNSVSRRRSNSDESCNSTKRIRSTSNCPPPEKELHRGNASNKVPKLNFEEISQDDEASTGVSMVISNAFFIFLWQALQNIYKNSLCHVVYHEREGYGQ